MKAIIIISVVLSSCSSGKECQPTNKDGFQIFKSKACLTKYIEWENKHLRDITNDVHTGKTIIGKDTTWISIDF